MVFTELETDTLFLRNICSRDRDFVSKYLFDAEPMKPINEVDELIEKYNGYGYMNEAIIKIIEFARINMRVKEIKAGIYYKMKNQKKLLRGTDLNMEK